jgi:nucleoside-diphosphate-sugar epimerase
MKLFVTGGTGFVGGHFLRRAMLSGHQIVALRRSGSAPSIDIGFEPNWIEGDLSEIPHGPFAGCDAFVHLAAHSANTPYDSLERCIHWNVTASVRAAAAASSSGVRRFLVAGSCFEYGKTADEYVEIPSNASLCPMGSYPTSKAMASLAFRELFRDSGLTGIIARLFQVYGEGEAESRFWPSLKAAALSGQDFPMSYGEQIRDFIEVGAAASRLVELVEMLPALEPGTRLEVNIGTGYPQTLREFAAEWWERLQAKGSLRFGALAYKKHELMRLVPDLTLLPGK